MEEGESQIALPEPNQPIREGNLKEGESQIGLTEPNQPTREGDLEEGESQIALPEPNLPTSEPNQPFALGITCLGLNRPWASGFLLI